MPSLGDSAVIIFLGLLLFGPKGLAQIARQLGKLMGEFRRASNEFRMQMEEELRVSEQADRQKEIAAIEAAAPPAPLLTSTAEQAEEEHPHMRTVAPALEEPIGEIEPIPIATSGALKIMPPQTGLPAPRSSSIAPLIDSLPHVNPPNGHVESVAPNGLDQKPVRYTNDDEAPVGATSASAIEPAAESVHG